MRITTLTVLFSLLLAPHAATQSDADLLWRVEGSRSHDAIGHKLHETYDLNGDGARDFIAINAFADTNGLTNNGLIQARSGLDGSVLWSHEGVLDGEALGRSFRRPGDLSGDGVHDFYVVNFDSSTGGLIENGFIRALDGATGAVLWQTDGTSNNEWIGYKNSLMEDINGDGADDFLVACPNASSGGLVGNGYVAALSGADGSAIWRFDGAVSAEAVGARLEYSRMLDADSLRDVVVSNPEADTGGLFHNGYVMALSGVDGSQMWRVDGSGNNRMLGQIVHTTHDLDGDTLRDIVLNDGDGSTGIFFQNGAVAAFSGATGSLLWETAGTNFLQRFGASFELTLDVDGDLISDFLIGAPDDSVGGLTNNGTVQALNGATGGVLWTAAGLASNDRLGSRMVVLGDLDGDTFPDILSVNSDASTGGMIENGSVFAISALAGSVLWRADGPVSGYHLGETVEVPIEPDDRDVSGDGVADALLGTPHADLGGLTNNGEVRALDGLSGATLWATSGAEDDERLGDIMDVNDDLDGDGVVDVVSASRYADTVGYTNNGSVHALAGSDGSHLWKLDGGAHDEYLGNDKGTIVAFDIDGDGHSEVLAGTPLADNGGLVDNGYIACVTAGVALPLECTPLIAGSPATLSLTGMVPGSRGGFVASLTGPAHTPVFGPNFWVGMDNPITLFVGNASATGSMSFTMTVPGAFAGMTARMQAVTTDFSSVQISRMLVRDIL